MKSEVIIGIVIKGTNVLIVKRKRRRRKFEMAISGGCPEKQNRRTNID